MSPRPLLFIYVGKFIKEELKVISGLRQKTGPPHAELQQNYEGVAIKTSHARREALQGCE